MSICIVASVLPPLSKQEEGSRRVHGVQMCRAVDAAAQDSPSSSKAAAGAGAGGRAGQLGAFFSQVRDAASKV